MVSINATASLRDIASNTITSDELLWTDRSGFCTVFPADSVVRKSDFQIAGVDSLKVETLRKLFSNPGYESTPISFARLRDIFVDTQLGVSATRNGTVIEETMIVARAIDPSLTTIHSIIDDSRNGLICPIIPEPVLHCFHRSSPAYGHFIFDCLSVIIWFRDVILANRIKVLFPPYFPQWGIDVLASLGIQRGYHLICPAGAAVLLQNVVIPTVIDTSNAFFPNRALCTGLHDILVSLTPAQTRRNRSRFIYLSRSNQTNYSKRSIVNEFAVQRLLLGMGFEVLEPGNMAFVDQIAAFDAAAIIIGGHGSSFGNLVAAQRGAVIIDLMPEAWIGFWDTAGAERWVLHMTTLFELDYVPILCKSHLNDEASTDDDMVRRGKGISYEVNLDILEDIVRTSQKLDYKLILN